jgi:hypothetical protein
MSTIDQFALDPSDIKEDAPRNKSKTVATYETTVENDVDFVVTRTKGRNRRSLAVRPSKHQLTGKDGQAPSTTFVDEMLSNAPNLPSWLPKRDTSRAMWHIVIAAVTNKAISTLITHGIMSFEMLTTEPSCDRKTFNATRPCVEDKAAKVIDRGIIQLWRVVEKLDITNDVRNYTACDIYSWSRVLRRNGQTDRHTRAVSAVITNERTCEVLHRIQDTYGDDTLADLLKKTTSSPASNTNLPTTKDTSVYFERARRQKCDIVDTALREYENEGYRTPLDMILACIDLATYQDEEASVMPRNIEQLKLQCEAKRQRDDARQADNQETSEPMPETTQPLEQGTRFESDDGTTTFTILASDGTNVAVSRQTTRTEQTLVLLPRDRQFYIRRGDTNNALTKHNLSSFMKKMPPVKLVTWLPAESTSVLTMEAIENESYLHMAATGRVSTETKQELINALNKTSRYSAKSRTFDVVWRAIADVVGQERLKRLVTWPTARQFAVTQICEHDLTTAQSVTADALLRNAIDELPLIITQATLIDIIGETALADIIRTWYVRACEDWQDRYACMYARDLDAQTLLYPIGDYRDIDTATEVATRLPKDTIDAFAPYLKRWCECESYAQTSQTFFRKWKLVLNDQIETEGRVTNPYPENLETLYERVILEHRREKNS